MGSVDILVNNAGVTRDNLFMRMSDDEWTSDLDINLTITMRQCKCAIRGMTQARWDRITNVSSIIRATGNPGQNRVRMALVADINECVEAAQRIVRYVDSLKM